MFWLTGRLGPTKHILPVSWMLFQSPKRMRISGSFMTQRVSSVSTQIRDEEAKSKLCKVRSVQANDTIKLDLETNKITDFVKFNVGNVVMVTGGRNRGRVGVIKNREKHKVSFETIHVQDATGHEFATRLGNVFTIGKGERPWVSLSKGKGIKLTIIEEAKKRQAAQQAATA